MDAARHRWRIVPGAALLIVSALVALVSCAVDGGRSAGDARPAADQSGRSQPPTHLPSSAPGSPSGAADVALVRMPELPGRGWLPSRPAVFPLAAEWPWGLRRCERIQRVRYPALEHRWQVRREVYRRFDGGLVAVMVERFAAGWGPRSVVDLRAVLETCQRYESAEFMESHTVRRASFSGDESLLIESVRITPPDQADTHHSVVVRRGDAVLTVVGAGTGAEPLAGLATVLAERI